MFWIIGGGAILESLPRIWSHPITEMIDVQLTHVEWEGFHLEDLIFPLFIFVMGVVLPFSICRRPWLDCGFAAIVPVLARRWAWRCQVGCAWSLAASVVPVSPQGILESLTPAGRGVAGGRKLGHMASVASTSPTCVSLRAFYDLNMDKWLDKPRQTWEIARRGQYRWFRPTGV